MDNKTTYTVTARGWCLLCPVWLADVDSVAIVPVPRFAWLGLWLELMYFIQQIFNVLMTWLDPRFEAGFWFHHVSDIQPFELTV